MNKADIIRMAFNAGLCNSTGGIEGDGGSYYSYVDEIVALARVVAAHERELCAKVCDQISDCMYSDLAADAKDACKECSEAIRSRKDTQ